MSGDKEREINAVEEQKKSVMFIMRYPLTEAYNLKQKFDGQMQAFVNMGYQVWHLAYDAENVYLVHVNTKQQTKIRKTHFGKFKKYRSTFGFLDLYMNLLRVAKRQSFQYAYMRSKPIDAIGLHALKLLKKNGTKVIVEIPSYNNQEVQLSAFRSIVNKVLQVWKNKFEKTVDLYTLIGADDEKEYRGKPAVTIENGISLETVPARKPRQNNDGIHMLALASMRYWHGFDRMIEGMENYHGKEKIYLHMVGSDGDGSLDRWRTLTDKYNLGDSVIFHGAMYKDKLNEMFDMCDVGIGTLGLHRTHNSFGSVLKTREYTVRGLPLVYGYTDSALTGNEPFVLQFPANDTPVNMDQLVSWALSMKSQPEIVQVMRDYALEHMSWEGQFKKVLSTIQTNENRK